MAFRGSSQSISASAPIISAPTRISAGAVAAAGIACTKGAKNSVHRNSSPDDDAGQPGAAADGNARSALDVARHRTRAGERADDHGERVREQDPVQSRNGSVGGHESGALGDRDQRPDVVEHVDEQEHEDDLDAATSPTPPLRFSAAGISSLKAVADRSREVVEAGREVREAERPADDRSDAECRSASQPLTASACSAAITSSPSSASAAVGVVSLPRPTSRAGIGDDDAGVLQADEGDEQPDAARHRRKRASAARRSMMSWRTPSEVSSRKAQARQEHAAERGLPGHPMPLTTV